MCFFYSKNLKTANSKITSIAIHGLFALTSIFMGFPDSSVGKESTRNAWESGSIPGSGRSAREGIGYAL